MVAIDPLGGEDYFRCGQKVQRLGELHLAKNYYEKAIEILPNRSDILHRYALLLVELGRLDEGLNRLQEALVLSRQNGGTESTRILCDKGVVLHNLGFYERALEEFDKVLNHEINNARILLNKAVSLRMLGRYVEAIECVSSLIARNPKQVDALIEKAEILLSSGRTLEGLSCYCEAKLLSPKRIGIYIRIARVFWDINKFKDALKVLSEALIIEPNNVDVNYNRAIVLIDLGESREAIASLSKLEGWSHDYLYLKGLVASLKMRDCDWNSFDQFTEDLFCSASIDSKAAAPATLIGFFDDPELQRNISVDYAKRFKYQRGCEAVRDLYAHSKIHIGYFSADFRNHPVMQLMWDVFKLHDRNRFRIYAFALKVEGDDPVQKGLRSDFDEFIDVESLSDFEVAERARQAGIDIAIDLMGFTRNSRTAIFAHRAAPIQINFLGYPGTMGAAYMDYIIADRVVIPETHRQFYTEEVLYLPNCFQPNMRMRAISGKVYTRQSVGLPDSGLVFCSFNNAYKITPTMFAAWMRILKGVEGSVLWIALNNETAIGNVKAYAKEQGVDPGRLVIAGRTATVEEHLARLPLADLFLDTYPYNAHTTATDAIRMGVPLLTLQGQSFASRVASSVLMTVGLEALVTTTLEGYERLAIELGNAPERLREIRRALALEAPRSSLFNAAQYTKDLEQVFLDVYALQSRTKAERLATPV